MTESASGQKLLEKRQRMWEAMIQQAFPAYKVAVWHSSELPLRSSSYAATLGNHSIAHIIRMKKPLNKSYFCSMVMDDREFICSKDFVGRVRCDIVNARWDLWNLLTEARNAPNTENDSDD